MTLTMYISSPKNIQYLNVSEVFVFGSNRSGIHGAGAAKTAHQFFGAKWGHGEGHFGQTYAIPTKDKRIQTLPLSSIQKHVNKFIQYARKNPTLTFLVTPIGCGLAGYDAKDIAPMFKDIPNNVHLPECFIKALER